MKFIQYLKSLALAVTLLTAGVANAGLYQFTLTGDYEASWQLDSNPTPDLAADGEGFIVWDVEGNFPGSLLDIADITFYNASIGGGFEIYDWWNDTYLVVTDGLQLYINSEDSPEFLTGTFNLTEYEGLGNYVLTIVDLDAPSDVPEPATGALLLGGLGLLAAARKRRQAT